MKSARRVIFQIALVCLFIAGPVLAATDSAVHRDWITDMKQAPRGPFERIRWFCKDGLNLPPQPYACKGHGGGSQHGEWSERTVALRERGYRIANFYTDLNIAEFVQHDARTDAFMQMLIEQFLIRADDGWILRKARYYRGAFQEEGERLGARRLLFKLAEDPHWLGFRYLPLRIAAQLLAHGRETTSIQEIRQLSAALSDRDPGFKTLRNKIHGNPEANDAMAVRNYLAGVADPELRTELERLATTIEAAYSRDVFEILEQLENQAAQIGGLAEVIRQARTDLAQDLSPRVRFQITARLLAALRDHLTVPNSPALRIQIIDTALAVESEHFKAGAALRESLATASRKDRLDLLGHSIEALYGTGLLSQRQRRALHTQLDRLDTDQPTVGTYKGVLDYLALAPSWGTQNLRLFFAEAMATLSQIEPKSNLFIQDQLRGSPMFFFAEIIDGMLRDANQLSGVHNELFGENVGAGLRSLNPGLARGRLELAVGEVVGELDSEGIYLLPETVSELPPVRGILTEGEGNPLSHVQLLARNLGIPNVGVDQSLLEKLRPHEGETVILAVSPAGSVRLFVDRGEWAAINGDDDAADADAAPADRTLIKVNLEKLDLNERDYLTLSQLRATDSGRVAGPKAAKLGELKHHYPDTVAEGLAIPFGVFRGLLDQAMPGENKTVFEWMQSEYRALDKLPVGGAERSEATERFRARLQDWILHADPGTRFRETLRKRMQEVFGADGSFGVFVRSDTNIEDLPGFTGAGLNLTVPNVVGFDNILAAISRVWASPFSARSFAWRQSLMDKPEHVYPAVLLMLSVDSDKSGVLVTCDIDTGSPAWISVSVNEGVGGAVDGQSAESLRVKLDNGEIKLLAQATAPYRRKIAATGGVAKLPVSETDTVLKRPEADQLITLVKELPDQFPAIVDANGKPAPADIEFGFVAGQLRLFQIRPFLESDDAHASAYLQSLDQDRETRGRDRVLLADVPRQSTPTIGATNYALPQ